MSITGGPYQQSVRNTVIPYKPQAYTIPKKRRLSIAAAWVKTLTANRELVDFKFLEISPGLMELKGSKDYKDVILIDADVSAILFDYMNKSTRLAITCDATV